MPTGSNSHNILYIMSIFLVAALACMFAHILYDSIAYRGIKDKMCDDFRHKLKQNWDDLLRCKLNLADYCNGQMKDELHRQHNLHNHYMDKITELAKRDWFNYFLVQNFFHAVSLFIEYHQTTAVDICGFNAKCIDCLRDCVNLWSKRNSTCNSENAWRVVQYSPNKRN